MNYYKEPSTDITPRDILIEREEAVKAESERERIFQILKNSFHFVIAQNSDNHTAVCYGILYALRDPETLTLSTRARARRIGCSSGLISYYKRQYEKEVLWKK